MYALCFWGYGVGKNLFAKEDTFTVCGGARCLGADVRARPCSAIGFHVPKCSLRLCVLFGPTEPHARKPGPDRPGRRDVGALHYAGTVPFRAHQVRYPGMSSIGPDQFIFSPSRK
jgi:hypothetical protein